jgi:hypothetical protein
MAITDGKLTAAQKKQVIEWLCEGLGNAEICKALAEDGVEVTQQAIDYYRGAYAEEIDEAREEALRKVVQQGFANRIKRIRALERNAERAVQLTLAGGKGWTQMSAELRAILKDIRDELGDLKQRHEHTGPGGGAVEVQHGGDAIDRLEGLLAGIAARSAEGGGAGATDAD